MNWSEVEELIQRERIAIVPTGENKWEAYKQYASVKKYRADTPLQAVQRLLEERDK